MITKENIEDLIKELHGKEYCGYENFKSRLANTIDKDKKNEILNSFIEGYDLLSHALHTFDMLRNHEISKCNKHKLILNELCTNGIYKWENLFVENDMIKITQFISAIEEALGSDITGGGKVQLYQNNTPTGIQTLAKNDHSMPHHGELRCQSKSLGGHPPGVEILAGNEKLLNTAKEYMVNPDTTFYRSTISWLNPAENTHIGWHIDSVYDVLKVMIFLTDVGLENGPMYFLKKTNTSTYNTVNKFRHNVFLWKPSKEKAPRMSDSYHELVHDPDPTALEKEAIISVGGDMFERVVATGKRGDAILFETSAVHSGNRALETRKTVILSTPNEISTPKNIFLSYIGYPRK